MRALLRAAYFAVVGLVARLLTPWRIGRYLAASGPHKLQIGAGETFAPGWLVSDIEPKSLRVLYQDATRRFPFPTASLDYVHSEHMIEHVPWSGGQAMLRECHRVLRPGGRLRIATPDAKVLLDLYGAARDTPDAKRYVSWMTRRCLPDAPVENPLFVINLAVRAWGHQFLYDAELLQDALQRAGFVDVQICRPGQSADPVLRGIEKHGAFVHDEWINDYETMVLEARRP